MQLRKVYEALYRDASSAVDELNAVGFTYTGRCGLLQRYHSYRGVIVTELGGDRRPRVETLYVRLFQDGLLRIYVDPKETTLGGISKIPDSVYHSYEHYRLDRQDFEQAQMDLRDTYGGKYALRWIDGKWCVEIVVLDQERGYKVFGNAEPERFDSWREAFKFAVAKSKAAVH